MSERGSFVTEYVYCDDCFAVLAALMLAPSSTDFLGEYRCRVHAFIPIIAGKIRGGYMGDEFHEFENWAEENYHRLCHEIRFAVLSDCRGSKIYGIGPKGYRILAEHPFAEPQE